MNNVIFAQSKRMAKAYVLANDRLDALLLRDGHAAFPARLHNHLFTTYHGLRKSRDREIDTHDFPDCSVPHADFLTVFLQPCRSLCHLDLANVFIPMLGALQSIINNV